MSETLWHYALLALKCVVVAASGLLGISLLAVNTQHTFNSCARPHPETKDRDFVVIIVYSLASFTLLLLGVLLCGLPRGALAIVLPVTLIGILVCVCGAAARGCYLKRQPSWMTQQLTSKNREIHERAIARLSELSANGTLDDDMAAALAQLLDYDDASTRQQVAAALLRSGWKADKEAVDKLLKFGRGSHEDLTKTSVRLLGQSGDQSAIEPLIGALGTGDRALRKEIAEALGELGEPGWKQWIKGEDEDWLRIVESKHPAVVDALELVLTRRRATHSERRVAARALISIARTEPEHIGLRWGRIAQQVAMPHHNDWQHDDGNGPASNGGASDCWHSDHRSHNDYGTGLDFPELPPGLKASKRPLRDF